RAGKAFETGLRGRVREEAVQRQPSLDRADVDDRASTLDQYRQRGLREHPGGFEIDGEHGVPVLLRHRDGIEVRVDSGVVDEPVKTAKRTLRVGYRPLDLLELPHVARKEMRCAAVGEAGRCLGTRPGGGGGGDPG